MEWITRVIDEILYHDAWILSFIIGAVAATILLAAIRKMARHIGFTLPAETKQAKVATFAFEVLSGILAVFLNIAHHIAALLK
ncbi:MAG: hypothetical protein AAGB97_03575 [Dehalococcoidia bacterium]